MKLSDIMAAAGLSGWAQVALILFLVAFILIGIAIFAPSRKSEFDRASRIPLDDSQPITPGRSSGGSL